MHYIDSFFIFVMAGIVCYYISKWLDRKKITRASLGYPTL